MLIRNYGYRIDEATVCYEAEALLGSTGSSGNLSSLWEVYRLLSADNSIQYCVA